jgi:hypothetical protein
MVAAAVAGIARGWVAAVAGDLVFLVCFEVDVAVDNRWLPFSVMTPELGTFYLWLFILVLLVAFVPASIGGAAIALTLRRCAQRAGLTLSRAVGVSAIVGLIAGGLVAVFVHVYGGTTALADTSRGSALLLVQVLTIATLAGVFHGWWFARWLRRRWPERAPRERSLCTD